MIVEGIEEVVADFTGASFSIPGRAGKVVKNVTEKVVGTMKVIVPKDRPELVNQIHPEVKGLVGEAVAEAQSDPRVMPHMVEYGTYKDPPQPFAGPSLDRHSPEFVREMEELGGQV